MAAATVQAKHIIAVDVQDERLQLAQSLGATHIISSGHESQESQHDAIMRITDGQGIDFALDCVGSPAVLADAQKLMAPQGTLLTVGGGTLDVHLNLHTHLQKGLTYRGCHQGDANPEIVGDIRLP